MSTETPRSSEHKRSASRNRPTTPLRPSSRSSFRDSARGSRDAPGSFPLNTFEPAFAELSDAMADLEANMMHFQLMHESLARFSESFSSFLYGLNMNAFCVDFPEVISLKRQDCIAGANILDRLLSRTRSAVNGQKRTQTNVPAQRALTTRAN